MVQSDDWLFPRCLEETVAAAETHPTAAMARAYRMTEAEVGAAGGHPHTGVQIEPVRACMKPARRQPFSAVRDRPPCDPPRVE